MFEFATAAKIVFGNGAVGKLGALAREYGTRALVVAGRDVERARPAIESLEQAGIHVVTTSVSGEPTIESVTDALTQAQAERVDCVISCGGGSPIDAGKALAALLTNGGEPLDYLEVIGKGRKITQPSAPFIAVPTTSGTGAEVTKNAVLGSTEHRVKVSLRSPYMLPRVALVDPALTHGVPAAVTASTGLDALTQVIEPYVSNQANPLTDALCLEGMRRGARSLVRAFEDGRDVDARTDMAVTSLFGGLALANAKLGAVHGFAGPIGGMFVAPHGAVCARLLPLIIETNVRALEQRQPSSPVLERYAEVARVLTGDEKARALDAADWTRRVCEQLGIAGFKAYGMSSDDIPTVVGKARAASSMKGNPIELTETELANALQQAL